MPPEEDSPGMKEARRLIAEAKRERNPVLDLSNLQLTTLPVSLRKLKALDTLQLTHNSLILLPEWVGELKRLRWLYLQDNKLTLLPESLGQLEALETLVLSNNQLMTLPRSLGQLQTLSWLFLDNNQLTALPEEVLNLVQLKELFLHGNPGLGLPEEVLGPRWSKAGRSKSLARPADILAYYFKSRKGGSRPLNEVKMVLVGRGEAGKSSIRDCLLGRKFDPKKKETQGIEIDTWHVGSGADQVRLHVWDFAGQELTHGTHQFFLTERSLYVLVLDGRADTQDRDAEYWLRLISAFGGDSPVLVVLNKYDTKAFDVDRFALQEQFPQLRAFLETDCKTGRGLGFLAEEISKTVAAMEAVHEPFPAAWSRTKDAFSEMEKSYVPFNTFRQECAARGVTEAKEQESLARILHRLGIVLHYADDPRLRDTTVLKPHWVTENIYRLLRLKSGPRSNGSVTFSEACAALPKEEPEMVRYLIGLMRRFELCFPVDNAEDRWLVPELLPRFQPPLDQDWQTAKALRLRYNYKVLPEGLLPRFITRTYPLSEGRARWRAGVVLEMDDARVLVRGDAVRSQVNVVVLGGEAGRQRLAKLVRNHFAHIHADLKGLKPEEEVEVEGRPGRFKSVTTLELDERYGVVTTVDTQEGSVELDQTRELNRISAPAARNPKTRRLRLFLSYSHKDTGLRDVFQENLALLEQDGLVQSWFDGKILPSAEWDKEIRRELEEADFIVFLVSTNFLASAYIRGVEMNRAVARREAGEAELVSVVLENCAWHGRDFTKYQFALPGNKPVRKWGRYRDAFNEVEKQLRQLIKARLAQGAGRAADDDIG